MGVTVWVILFVLETVMVKEVLLERVCDTDLVRDIVTVGLIDCVSDFVRVSEMVGVKELVKLVDLVNGGVVGIGENDKVGVTD